MYLCKTTTNEELVLDTEHGFSTGPWFTTLFPLDGAGPAEVAVRYLLSAFVQFATDCGSENHSDTHPQTDAVYRDPEADAEREADASATLHPALRHF